MKNKNIAKRVIAVTVTILILSSLTVSAGDTWTAPKISFTPLKNPKAFTDKDAAWLAEALSEADFFNDKISDEEFKNQMPKSYLKESDQYFLLYAEYDFIKEKDYDIRRVELKHGYHIDMVFVSQHNNGVSSAYIRNTNGYVIAEIILTAKFTSDKKQVKSISQKITGKSYVSQITFFDKYAKNCGERPNVSLADAGITLKIKDAEYKYNAQVKCDIYGNTISYFSWQKKPFINPKKADTLTINGEAYYTFSSGEAANGETVAKFAGISDDIPNFNDKDASKLAEALALADYSKFELTNIGKNYEIKRLHLKYGYYIDFVFRNKNDTVTSDYNYNKKESCGSIFESIDIYIRDPNGDKLAAIEFCTNFTPFFLYDETVKPGNYEYNGISAAYDKSTSLITYHGVYTESYVPQITFSGKKSRGIENATDFSSIVDGVFTLNIKDGAKTKDFTINMQVECYFNGIATAWVG